jgi:hypothetical protein
MDDVQWHPEDTAATNPLQVEIFARLVAASADRHQTRDGSLRVAPAMRADNRGPGSTASSRSASSR